MRKKHLYTILSTFVALCMRFPPRVRDSPVRQTSAGTNAYERESPSPIRRELLVLFFSSHGSRAGLQPGDPVVFSPRILAQSKCESTNSFAVSTSRRWTTLVQGNAPLM